jgi:hypothetical protein
MQRVVIAAAAMLLGAGVAVSTAKAELNPGPVVDQAKGLCFTKSNGQDPATFGYWDTCPKPAAATTVHRHPVKHGAKSAEEH